jgi:hypothetical protein
MRITYIRKTNIDKMSKGEPVTRTDADRAPWLVDVHRTAFKVAESESQDNTPWESSIFLIVRSCSHEPELTFCVFYGSVISVLDVILCVFRPKTLFLQ